VGREAEARVRRHPAATDLAGSQTGSRLRGAAGRLVAVVGGLGPLVAAQAVNAAGNFVSLTLTAKQLGPTDYGEYAVFLATALVVTQVSDAGLGRAITLVCSRLSPESARQDLRQTYATGWSLRVATHVAVIILFAAFAAIALTAHRPLLAYFAAGSLAGLAASLALFAAGVFQTERRFLTLALLNGLPGVLRALLVIALAWSGRLGLGTAAAAYSLAPLLAVLLVSSQLGLLDLRSVRPGRAQLRRLWSAGKWIALAAALEVLYQRVDVIGLRVLSTSQETGIYAGAFLFISAINFVILSVNAQAYPALAAAAERRDLTELRQVFTASTALLVVVGVPLVCAVATVFPDVSTGVLGSAYARSVVPMRLLAVYGVATVIQFNCGALFLAMGRSSLVVLWSLLLVLVEGLGIALAVPRFGAAGAAAAVAVAMAAMLPLSWVWVTRLIGFAIPVRAIAVTALLSGAALLFLWVASPSRPGAADVALKLVVWAVVAAGALAVSARQTQPLLAAARRR
jgi:O-antigen/teichoic acid export membrane protein